MLKLRGAMPPSSLCDYLTKSEKPILNWIDGALRASLKYRL